MLICVFHGKEEALRKIMRKFTYALKSSYFSFVVCLQMCIYLNRATYRELRTAFGIKYGEMLYVIPLSVCMCV